MLDTLRHLLPDSTAWRLVVERTLKKYLRGVATVGSDVVAFVDDVYDDLWPDLTRELDEWMDQFGIDPRRWANDDDMRAYLDFRWGEDRSTSPQALQDKLRAAGFTDAHVYDSFDKMDVSLTTYTADTIDLSAQMTADTGFAFAQNGTLLYVADDVGDVIYQYTLASPYYLSTATYTGKSLQVTTWANPTDIHIRDDGLKLYVINFATDVIVEFDLTTPFDVSTGVFNQYGTDFTTQEGTPQSMHFALDGTRVYLTGTTSDQVHRFDMSVAWDVSTMSHVNSYDPTITDPLSVTFTPDGLVMLIAPSTGLVTQYNLSTAWDITSASAASRTVDLTDITDPVVAVKLIDGGLYGLSSNTHTLHRYRYGAWRNPLDYTDQPKSGTVQCGDDGSGINPVAECGEEPPDQLSSDSALCNTLLANDVWYLVNDKLTGEAPPKISELAAPYDSIFWGNYWYVGSTQFGSTIYELVVDEYDRQRFEKLCLKHGPTNAWIVTVIDVWRTTLLGTWDFESVGDALDAGEWQFTAATISPVKIHDIDADGVDRSAVLATFANGDRIRFKKPNGEWIEYAVLGSAVDNTTYYHVPIDSTLESGKSSDWSGFIGQFQIYFREQV